MHWSEIILLYTNSIFEYSYNNNAFSCKNKIMNSYNLYQIIRYKINNKIKIKRTKYYSTAVILFKNSTSEIITKINTDSPTSKNVYGCS